MKIRTGYVSNSSSSSFLLVGKNIVFKFKKFLTSNEKFIPKDYYAEHDIYNVNRIFESLLNEIKNYNTQERIIEFIYNKLYELCSAYYNNKSSIHTLFNYVDNKFIDMCKNLLGVNDVINTLKYDIDTKKSIEKEMYFSLYENEKKLDQIIDKQLRILSEKIYSILTDQNNEVYVVNYGNDGSAEDTAYTCMIEYDFLGNNEISDFVDDITVLQISEH